MTPIKEKLIEAVSLMAEDEVKRLWETVQKEYDLKGKAGKDTEAVKSEEDSILQYHMKLLHTMLVASTENFNLHFFSFIIDYNISQRQTKDIMHGLMLLNHRMRYGKISDELRDLIGDDKIFNVLDKDTPPSISEFNQFINELLGKDINVEHLLKRLLMQGINEELCQTLLDSIKK